MLPDNFQERIIRLYLKKDISTIKPAMKAIIISKLHGAFKTYIGERNNGSIRTFSEVL
jgi:hypothetical protein